MQIKHMIITAALCLLTGCGSKPTDSAVFTESNTTVSGTETGTSPDTVQTAPSRSTALTSAKSTAPDTSAEPETTASALSSVTSLSDRQSDVTTLVQGGQGGEEHASDPAPLYFTYRFFPDSVSMRLAGGNYQTIFYDFAAAAEHDVDSLYHLTDYNFDRIPDLAVPVIFADRNITYAVFLWLPETSRFDPEPILLCNPASDADAKTVTSLVYGNESELESVLRFFVWDGDALLETRSLCADYHELILTDSSEGAEQTKQFESAEALRDALLSFRQTSD